VLAHPDNQISCKNMNMSASKLQYAGGEGTLLLVSAPHVKLDAGVKAWDEPAPHLFHLPGMSA